MVAAAAVSQIGQFEAEMSSDSFQLLGMAERGFLPKGLARRSKHDTPTVSPLPLLEFPWSSPQSPPPPPRPPNAYPILALHSASVCNPTCLSFA